MTYDQFLLLMDRAKQVHDNENATLYKLFVPELGNDIAVLLDKRTDEILTVADWQGPQPNSIGEMIQDYDLYPAMDMCD